MLCIYILCLSIYGQARTQGGAVFLLPPTPWDIWAKVKIRYGDVKISPL